jgi:hypothetical protein
MAAETSIITGKIQAKTLSDRDILLHLLQHAEDQQATIDEMAGKITAMHAELEAARPLLERARSPVGRVLGGMRPWGQ